MKGSSRGSVRRAARPIGAPVTSRTQRHGGLGGWYRSAVVVTLSATEARPEAALLRSDTG